MNKTQDYGLKTRKSVAKLFAIVVISKILSLISGIKSSGSKMIFKIGVLKNFGKFHRKTPVLESLFNKVAGFQALLQ